MSYRFKYEKRVEVFNKYKGKCAYCGVGLDVSSMQIDHIIPVYRGSTDKDLEHFGVKKGTNDFENLNPSCRSCNSSKSTFTLEQWRNEIRLKYNRLNRDNSTFRILQRFNIVSVNNVDIKFYFEKQKK